MIQTWRDLSEDGQAEIADDFIARTRARNSMAVALTQTGISHRRLYAYAKNPATDYDGAISKALRRGGRLWRDWNAILDLAGAVTLQAAAAAATSDDAPRGYAPQGSWRYELHRSPEPPHEYYLIIDLDADENPPSRFQAHSASAGMADIVLEPPFRGVIQIILEDTHPLIAVLNDPDCKVRMW